MQSRTNGQRETEEVQTISGKDHIPNAVSRAHFSNYTSREGFKKKGAAKANELDWQQLTTMEYHPGHVAGKYCLCCSEIELIACHNKHKTVNITTEASSDLLQVWLLPEILPAHNITIHSSVYKTFE